MASAALDGVASQQTDRFAVWLVLNNETQVWLRRTCVLFSGAATYLIFLCAEDNPWDFLNCS